VIPLTDDRLRQLAYDDMVCTNANERAMAAELLAARARIAELERCLRDEGASAGRLADQLRASCTQGADAAARVAELEAEVEDHIEANHNLARERTILRGKVAELGAAQRPPLAYLVARIPNDTEEGPSFLGDFYSSRAAAKEVADQRNPLTGKARYVVAEIREVPGCAT